MPRQFVLLILIVVTAIVSLALANASLSQYLSSCIALAALVVSVVSAFKEDVFPFRPSTVFAELSLILLPAPSDSLALLVPIYFVNNGHGAGVIEGLTLTVEGPDSTKAYTPVAEVDYGKLRSRKRALDAESMLGGFNAFPIGSRQSLQKHFLFTQEEKSKRYPFTNWQPGKFTFRLFVKHSASDKPIEVGSVAYEIGRDALAACISGEGVSYCPTRELEI